MLVPQSLNQIQFFSPERLSALFFSNNLFHKVGRTWNDNKLIFKNSIFFKLIREVLVMILLCFCLGLQRLNTNRELRTNYFLINIRITFLIRKSTDAAKIALWQLIKRAIYWNTSQHINKKPAINFFTSPIFSSKKNYQLLSRSFSQALIIGFCSINVPNFKKKSFSVSHCEQLICDFICNYKNNLISLIIFTCRFVRTSFDFYNYSIRFKLYQQLIKKSNTVVVFSFTFATYHIARDCAKKKLLHKSPLLFRVLKIATSDDVHFVGKLSKHWKILRQLGCAPSSRFLV